MKPLSVAFIAFLACKIYRFDTAFLTLPLKINDRESLHGQFQKIRVNITNITGSSRRPAVPAV
jgi:hypothetical protein